MEVEEINEGYIRMLKYKHSMTMSHPAMSQTDTSIPERSLLSFSLAPARHSHAHAYVTASTPC